MTNLLGLEEPLSNWRAAISAVHLIADSIDDSGSDEKAALDWISYNMTRDYEAAKAWFDEAIEAQVEAKGDGPVAVS